MIRLFEHSSDLMCVASTDGYLKNINPAWEKMLGYTPEELLQKPFVDFIHPDDIQPTLKEIKKLIKGNATVNFINRYRCKDGSYKWLEWHSAHAENKTILYAMARDITERKQEEFCHKFTTEILAILNDLPVLALAINKILSVIKMRMRLDAVGIRLRSGEDYPYYDQKGFSKHFLSTENSLIARDKDGKICKTKNGGICLECTCGLVIAKKARFKDSILTKNGIFWTNNSLPLLDIPEDEEQRFNPRNCCIKEGFLSIALIPLQANGETVGLLQLNAQRKNCFTPQLIHCLDGICANIGLALMRKQAEKMQQEAGERSKMFLQRVLAVREEEKKKLSVDLHDELGTMSVALNADLSIIQSDLEGKNYKEALKNIAKTTIILKKEIAVLKKIAQELRPPNLDIVGLVGVLKEKLSKKAKESGLRIYFKAGKGMNHLDDKTATVIYRVTQEAFTNIVKHAKAKKVIVNLRNEKNQFKYTICDDGKGFNVDHALKNLSVFKLGLQGMRERIESLGGVFSIESVLNKGTAIRITVPTSADKVKK